MNYQLWKIRMKICVQSTDKGIWEVIENGHFIPETEKKWRVYCKTLL